MLGADWSGDQTIARSRNTSEKTYVSASTRIRTYGSHVREDRQVRPGSHCDRIQVFGVFGRNITLIFSPVPRVLHFLAFNFGFNHSNENMRRLKSVTLQIVWFSPSTYYFLFPLSTYCPQHSVPTHSMSEFFLHSTGRTSHIRKGKEYINA